MLVILYSWALTTGLTGLLGWSAWRATGRLGLATAAAAPPLEWLCLGGLALLTAVLEGWSLLLPPGGVAQAVTAIIAGILLLTQGDALWRGLRQARINWPLIGLAAIPGAWVLLLSAYTYPGFDTGLYHLQSLRWLQEYAAVPGLGNLHGRLAFNPALFAPMALLRVGTSADDVYGLGSWCFALLALTVARLLLLALAADAAPGALRRAGAGAALLLGALLAFEGRIGSPSPDGAVAVLVGLLFLLYALKRDYGTGRRPDAATALLVLLAALAATTKLAAVPALLVPAHSLWAARRALHTRQVVALGAALLVPWLARNALLSGYLVYPLPGATVPGWAPDWQVPAAYARLEQHLIINVARHALTPVFALPQGLLTSWWPAWWQALPLGRRALVALALASPVVALVRAHRPAAPTAAGWRIGWAVAWFGTLLWLTAAPDPRFGLGFLLVAAAWPWLALLPGRRAAPRKATNYVARRPARGLALALTGGVLLVAVQQLRAPLYLLRHPKPGLRRALVWPYLLPVPPTRTVLLGAVRIHIPLSNDPRCGAAALPCAYCLEAGLEARGRTAAAGFRRRGDVHYLPTVCMSYVYDPVGA